MTQVLALHHVTAIASDPQRNIDFYAGVLGLRHRSAWKHGRACQAVYATDMAHLMRSMSTDAS